MSLNAGGNKIRPEVSGRLTIDLAALRSNYRKLASLASDAECAGVIKADAYGTGAEAVCQALSQEGCQTFFVATISEALRVRSVLADVSVYVLDGLPPDCADLFAAQSLRPVLGSIAEIEDWAAYCQHCQTCLPAAVHIDTGMNRLGLSAKDIKAIADRSDLFAGFELALVMSHLACADDPDSPMTEAQRIAFDELRRMLPAAPASLANSAGILSGQAYHYDLVRAGVALYGGRARSVQTNPMLPVVSLDGRIAQIRHIEKGETIGYGATFRASAPMIIATVSIGYADGFFRLLSATNEKAGATAYIGNYAAPLVGRVSMDLVTLDVTDVPADHVSRGAFVELIGSHNSVDDIADLAQTIGYEVLTSLGTRTERLYVGA